MNPIQEEFGVQDDDGTTTYVLGPPLTPRLDRHRYSYGESEEELDEKAEGGRSSLEDQDLEAHWSYTSHTPTPTPTNQNQRLTSSSSSSTPSLSHQPSISSIGDTPSIASSSRRIHPSFNITPLVIPDSHSHSEQLTHRASSSSLRSATSPLSSSTIALSKPLRSRVSMDALPQQRPLSIASSIRSYRSQSSLADNAEVPWTYHPQSSINARASNDGNAPIDVEDEHDLEEEEEEEDEDGPVPAMRPLADATLRSVPGVIGLGEGWAGGPQRKSSMKQKWWSRRNSRGLESDQAAIKDDPLALWATSTPGPGKRDQSSASASPVRTIWNRSRSAFGGSMPVLPTFSTVKDARIRKQANSARDRDRREREREEQSAKPVLPSSADKTAKRRSLAALFSRSQTTLISATRSTPHLGATITPPRSLISTSETASAETNRSEPHLPSIPHAQPQPPAPVHTARVISGPLPPWRPISYVAPSSSSHNNSHTVRFHDSPIDDLDAASIAAVAPEPTLLNKDKDLPPRPPSAETDMDTNEPRPNALRRTSTFGAYDIAMEQGLGIDTPLGIGEKKRVYENEGLRQSTVGFDTIAAWAEEPKKHKTPMDRNRRRESVFHKIRTALSPSPSSPSSSASPSPLRIPTPVFRRPSTPSPLKLFSLAKSEPPRRPSLTTSTSTPIIARPRRDSDPAYLTTREAVKEALETPRPQTGMSNNRPSSNTSKRIRRSSWMTGSENWMKRLSKLTEMDEDALTPSPGEDSPDDHKRSFFDRVMPVRSSSLMPIRTPLRRQGMSNSMSVPALTRLTTTQLDLRLDLPHEDGLGLDDILDSSRRRSIIDMFDLERNNPFPIPPPRSPSLRQGSVKRNASTRTVASTDTASVIRTSKGSRSHARGVSEPHFTAASAVMAPSTSGHSRNVSEPTDSIPALEKSHSVNTTSESGGSSTFPETPHMPTSLPPRQLTQINPYLRAVQDQNHSSTASFASLRSDVSFYSAREGEEGSDDEGHGDLGLTKAESRLSDISTDAVVEQAIKITSLEDMQRKASVFSMEELRLNSPTLV